MTAGRGDCPVGHAGSLPSSPSWARLGAGKGEKGEEREEEEEEE